MPVPLRTTYQRAEAKYNVTTEFPSLGLHSAAATGNVGLVEYALVHGQPINSVLDGVLPLHAACAGGNVQVVKLLIDHGADVNAPRLPRRYSNDKNRDSSAPIVGTSGSTPLHFAAANGNTDVVTVLLLHGAHADRPDKHGVTPEMLARQNGWLECAEVLRKWLVDKDRDLRERPGGMEDSRNIASGSFTTRERLGSFGVDTESPSSIASRRRIHVKQSIDTALNMLKSASTDMKLQLPPSSINHATSTPPASPSKPFGEYTFHPVHVSEDDGLNPIDGTSRRPSLPQILQPPPIGRACIRKTSTPAINNSPSPQKLQPDGIGTEDQDQEPSYRPTGVRKLGSKYSLMNLFKKGQAGEGASTDVSQSALSVSPPSTVTLSLSTSPNPSSPLSNPPGSTHLNETTSSSPGSISPLIRTGFRFHRGSDASTRVPSQQPQPLHRKTSITSRPPLPSAVDLHNALAQERQERQERHFHQTRDRSRSTGSGTQLNPDEDTRPNPSPTSSPLTRIGLLRSPGQNRVRSGSGGSLGADSSPGHRNGAVFGDDVMIVTGDGNNSGGGGVGVRPSILKAHSRTSSGSQVPLSSSAYRTLRFDSSSSTGSGGRRGEAEVEGLGTIPNLRGSNSVGSFTKYKSARSASPESRLSEEDLIPDSAPAVVGDFDAHPRHNIKGEDLVDEEEDVEYGQPLASKNRTPIDPGTLELKTPRIALLMRERGLSFGSSSESSLSPISSSEAQDTSSLNADFPFSINNPPPSDGDEAPIPNQELLRVPTSGDNRSRGDSVSSTSTSDSHSDPQLSASGTTNGSGGSDTITTPYLSSSGPDTFLTILTDSNGNVEGLVTEDIKNDRMAVNSKGRKPDLPGGATTVLNERRLHIPPDINISSISSHAQAEALVQKAQQDILEMVLTNDLSPNTASTGRSPLSARLAAYGESLALERKLREQKEVEDGQKANHSPVSPKSDVFVRNGATTQTAGTTRKDGIERQHSLEHKPNRPKLRTRMKDPKRPSTAEGVSPSPKEHPFSGDSGRSHHSSRSASGVGPSPSSRLSVDQEIASSDEQGSPATPPTHSKSATLSVNKYDLDPSPGHRRIANRSYTPVPGTGSGELSRVSSLEGLDTDTELGPALFRVSTAPLGPVRGAKTATKLARMGFPSTEQARVPSTPTNKRFGAIRSLVQTLKGRT